MSNNLTNAKLVKVMTYGSSHVAHTAKGLLAEHGIMADVQGDVLADAFSYYGSAVSKTEIVTLEEDAERALQILQQMEMEAETGPWSDGPTLWLCDQCEEQNARTFDQCWSNVPIAPQTRKRFPFPLKKTNNTSSIQNYPFLSPSKMMNHRTEFRSLETSRSTSTSSLDA